MENALNTSKNHGRDGLPRKRSGHRDPETKQIRRTRDTAINANRRQRRRRDTHAVDRIEAMERPEQATSTDSLELFLRQARVHPLLTAAEEKELHGARRCLSTPPRCNW